MPNGWTDPIFFNIKQKTAGITDTLTHEFAAGFMIELTDIEALNATADRGTVHGYTYKKAAQGGCALFNGTLQTVGTGVANATFLWQGKRVFEGFLSVNFYDVVANDVLYISGYYRMRRL